MTISSQPSQKIKKFNAYMYGKLGYYKIASGVFACKMFSYISCFNVDFKK